MTPKAKFGIFCGAYTILTTLGSPPAIAETSLNAEFPNYFTDNTATRTTLVLDDTPAGAHTKTLRRPVNLEKTQAALASLLARLQVTYIDGTISKQLYFFQELKKQIQEETTEVDLYVGGEVVQRLLAYIYEEIYNAKKKSRASTSAILDQIAKSRTSLSLLRVLGPVTPLQIWIGPATEPPQEQSVKAIRNAREVGRDFIKSVRKLDGARLEIPIEIKDYFTETTQLFQKGGSHLDLLAFSLITDLIKTPTQDPEVFRDFLAGTFDFGAAENIQKFGIAEARNHRLIRGVGTLIEFPFIQPSQTARAEMLQEMDQSITEADRGSELSDYSLYLLEKTIKKSRFKLAHDRLGRSDGAVEKKFRLWMDHENHAVEMGKRRKTLISETLWTINTSTRNVKDFPKDLLMDHAEFMSQYTAQGILYHGISVDRPLSVLRNQLFVKGAKASDATSPVDLSTICTYGPDHNRCLLPLGVKTDPKMRIFNIRDPSRDLRLDARYTKIIEEYRAENKDQKRSLYDYLFREYGIDIIVDKHVIVQNFFVIKLPQNPLYSIRTFILKLDLEMNTLLSKQVAPDLLEDMLRYRELYSLVYEMRQTEGFIPYFSILDRYFEKIGSPTLGPLAVESPVEQEKKIFSETLKSVYAPIRLIAVNSIDLLSVQDPHFAYSLLRTALADSDDQIRAQAISKYLKYIPADLSDDEKVAFIFSILRNPNQKERKAELLILQNSFDGLTTRDNRTLPIIKVLLDSPDPETKLLGLSGVRTIVGDEKIALLEEMSEDSNLLRFPRVLEATIAFIATAARDVIHDGIKQRKVDSFFRMASESKDPGVRIALASVLQHYQGDDKAEFIRRFVFDPNDDVARAAFFAVGEVFDGSDADSSVFTLLNHPKKDTYLAVLNKLFPLTPQNERPLKALLYPDVRIQDGLLKILISLNGMKSCFKTIEVNSGDDSKEFSLAELGLDSSVLPKLWYVAGRASPGAASSEFARCYHSALPDLRNAPASYTDLLMSVDNAIHSKVAAKAGRRKSKSN